MSKNILVVDDDISILDGFKEVLSQEGYWVESAVNEEEALLSLQERHYHFVITDLVLKETTGLELINKIKDISSDTAIIMITAYPTLETAIRSFRAGVIDFLIKPIRKKDLLEAIQKKERETKDGSVTPAEKIIEVKQKIDINPTPSYLSHVGSNIQAMSEEIQRENSLLLKTGIDHKQVALLQLIQMNSALLYNLANNVSDMTRIDARKIELHDEDFDLVRVITDVVKMVYPAIKDKPVEFSYEIDPDIPKSLNGDQGKLRQILINLLSNAVKFTKEGEVKLKARLMTILGKGCHVFFVIKDTGPGIPKERQIDIFKPPAQRLLEGRGQKINFGLGLWISKILVEKMGGLISLHSELGLGSEFRFSIRFSMKDR